MNSTPPNCSLRSGKMENVASPEEVAKPNFGGERNVRSLKKTWRIINDRRFSIVVRPKFYIYHVPRVCNLFTVKVVLLDICPVSMLMRRQLARI